MSSKIKNITRLVQGKTLAKASVSAARAAASMMATTERPLTTDADIHPPAKEQITHPPLHVLLRKQIREGTKRRNSSRKTFEPPWHIIEAYQKEVDESEGFDVSYVPIPGNITSVSDSKDVLADRFNGPVKSAIELYNKEMDAKFKLVEIKNANWAPPLTYLITFTAVEDENDGPKVFECALMSSFSRKTEPTVTLCRQKGKRLEGYKTDDYIRGS